ncbi:MAG: 5-(carboxyamino)imidazole ribonucleotide mutase [Halioglobus sp.]
MSAVVGVIMGSDSDLGIMQGAVDILRELEVPFELDIVSAHRTPDKLHAYASSAEERGLKVIIAGAGGAAHLPGMAAALTLLPVIGVPIGVTALQGVDALLSIVQMPRGVPVATVAIDNAANAAVLAAQVIATGDPALRERLRNYRDQLRDSVLAKSARLQQLRPS